MKAKDKSFYIKVVNNFHSLSGNGATAEKTLRQPSYFHHKFDQVTGMEKLEVLSPRMKGKAVKEGRQKERLACFFLP